MQKPWSVPTNREIANKYFKVVCAHEEIHCLNIKIRRLNAWIIHENQVMKSAADTAMDPHIAVELHHCYTEWHHVNNIHCTRISSIYKLEGFSGPGPFVPKGNTLEDLSCSGQDLIDEEDDGEDDVLWLRDFLDTLKID